MSKVKDISEEKEIQKGITLIKEMKENENGQKIYVFSLKVERLNTVEFIADFSESKNVEMLDPVRVGSLEAQNGRPGNPMSSQGQDSIKYFNAQSKSQRTDIQPDRKEIVCVLLLKDGWELKSKLKYIIKPAPKEEQKRAITEDEQLKKEEIKQVVPLVGKKPLSLKTTGECIMLLKEVLNPKQPPPQPVPQNNTLENSYQQQIQQPPPQQQPIKKQQLKYIDPEFLPTNESIFGEKFDDSAFDTLIQWRRPKDIFSEKKPINIFPETIQPWDIVAGQLTNFWFLSSVATLAEKPAYIKRLFLTQDVNEVGFYRVKICKNGEWQQVSVDDYFPCNPKDGPIFSHAENQSDDEYFRRNDSNKYSKDCHQIWLLILEKAYAKIHGDYFKLKNGSEKKCEHALMDLTGCPVEKIDFQKATRNNQSEHDLLIKTILEYQDKRYIMNLQSDDSGHAYAIIQVRRYNNQLLFNIRNIWEHFQWEGEWSYKSALWDNNATATLNPQNGDPKQFWMKLDHVLEKFKCINIVKIQDWNEVRVKGKFVKVEDINDPTIETYMSKWYYQFEVTERCLEGKEKELTVTLHQEDELIKGVEEGRPYLDISLSLFRIRHQSIDEKNSQKKNQISNYKYEQLHHTKFDLESMHDQFKNERQVSLTIPISKPGIYILLPRTNGLGFKDIRKKGKIASLFQKSKSTEKVDKNANQEKLTELLESTLVDIFRKFDMLLTRRMSYRQFKAFKECTQENDRIYDMDFENSVKQEFKQLLEEYPSDDECLSQEGFIQYMKDKVLRVKDHGKDDYISKFQNLGYHESLHSIRSRCFILSFHFESPIEIIVRDAISTNLDLKAARGYIDKFKNQQKVFYQIKEGETVIMHFFSYYSKNANYTTFSVQNVIATNAFEVEVNFQKLLIDNPRYKDNFFSSGVGYVKKRVERLPKFKEDEKHYEVLFHMRGLFSSDDYNNINFGSYIRYARCKD